VLIEHGMGARTQGGVRIMHVRGVGTHLPLLRRERLYRREWWSTSLA
jgi:hypothetical protein